MIEVDVPCVRCRYNLRGLDEVGACPECGAGAAESVARHRWTVCGRDVPLALADGAWVRRLARGTLLLLATAGWRLFIGLFFELPVLRRLYVGMHVVLRVSLFTVGDLLGFAALWWLTTPEPTTPRPSRLRYALRVAAGVALVESLVVAPTGILRGVVPVPYLMAGTIHTLTSAAVAALGFAYLGSLAHRTARPRLRRSALGVAWAVPVVLMLPMLPRLIDVGITTGPPPLHMTGHVESLPALVVMLADDAQLRPAAILWLLETAVSLIAVGVIGRAGWEVRSAAGSGRKNAASLNP